MVNRTDRRAWVEKMDAAMILSGSARRKDAEE
jgi:hypothetical protein